MDRQDRIKTWILRVVLYVLALFSLAMVAGTRIPSFGRWLTSLAKVHGGDLYAMSGLGFFRETDRRYIPNTNDCSLEESRIIVFSDSFGNVSPAPGAFHTRLQNELGVPVYWKLHKRKNGSLYPHPLQWLDAEAPDLPRGKILVMMRTERYVDGTMYNPRGLSARPPVPREPTPENVSETISAKPKEIIYRALFDNSKLEYLFKNSFMTRCAYEAIASGRFIFHNDTSNLVPKYSLRPKMLFYYGAIDSFNQPIESKRLEDMLEFFTLLDKELKEKYGITLILVPVPNKYTIYHDYADPSSVYNNYLTIVADELERRGIICVDLYPAFMEQREEILYWSDDTHWNGKALDIAVNLTAETIREHGLLGGREQGEWKEPTGDAGAEEPSRSGVVAE